MRAQLSPRSCMPSFEQRLDLTKLVESILSVGVNCQMPTAK